MQSLRLALLLSSAAIGDICIAESKETSGLSGDPGGSEDKKLGQ